MEIRPIRDLIGEVIPQPADWINTPHDLLGGKTPNDLIGTDQEDRVRELTRAFKNGMFI